MPATVDACTHRFEHLVRTVLPAHMERLRPALTSPWPAQDLAMSGVGPRGILKKMGRASDFSGCYVFLKDQHPIYVGISRGVIARIRQHLVGKSHFDASLPYLMAQRVTPTRGRRAEVMCIDAFLRSFEAAQKSLRACSVAVVEIENPVELHVFEVYAALELGTGEWNTFRTH